MAQSRIGILGGSFNPVHCRHIQIALCALEELNLDQVLFIPNGNPPHKQHALADAKHRYEMTRLAVLPYENFTVSDIELTRSGVIYTVDTLKLLHKLHPDAEFFFLIGEDTLLELPHWRNPDELFTLSSFAVCPRSGQTASNHPAVADLRARGARFTFLSLEPSDISATDIRRRIAAGENTGTLLPPQVFEYIRIAGLYGCPVLWENAQQAYAMLKNDLSEDRLIHSMSSAYMAAKLAQKYGLDTDACELAGLLHDCAKCMDLKTLKQIAQERKLQLSDIEMRSNALLHGPVGAVIAKTKYGVKNPEILTAISTHTTGCPGMSLFDMAVYLADKIEPLRSDFPSLNAIREQANTDLYKASYQMLVQSKAHVAHTKRPSHPATDETIQWVRERIR